MKTAGLWFKDVPSGELKDKLLSMPIKVTYPPYVYDSLHEAVGNSFEISSQPEGELFWDGVYDFLRFSKMDYMKSIEADYLDGYNLAKETFKEADNV